MSYLFQNDDVAFFGKMTRGYYTVTLGFCLFSSILLVTSMDTPDPNWGSLAIHHGTTSLRSYLLLHKHIVILE